MANITYLIGAGASANALPVVSDMNFRMRFYLNYLKKHRNSLLSGLEKEVRDNIISNFEDVLAQTLFHTTPDTFAKKLFLKGDSDSLHWLGVLKEFLSTYFLFEQSLSIDTKFDDDLLDGIGEHVNIKLVKNPDFDELRQDNNGGVFRGSHFIPRYYQDRTDVDNFFNKVKIPLDKRYDVFLATLLDKNEDKLILPNNVNIISWNYDLQLELAYTSFDREDSMSALNNLNIYPIAKLDENKSGVVYLNGKAGLCSDDNFQSFKAFDFDKFLTNPLDAIKELFTALGGKRNISSYLNFAWELESNKIAKSAVQLAKEILTRTDVLVIIGYSFPNFNKKIDRIIMEEFKGKKVYYQAHPNEIEALCKNFHWLMEGRVNAEPIIDLKQFFIPPEFVFAQPAGTDYFFGNEVDFR